tara:strand:+ start:1223 stop:1489 length:267 start_codon:yes stop_codon:yes gene_type:complete
MDKTKANIKSSFNKSVKKYSFNLLPIIKKNFSINLNVRNSEKLISLSSIGYYVVESLSKYLFINGYAFLGSVLFSKRAFFLYPLNEKA